MEFLINFVCWLGLFSVAEGNASIIPWTIVTNISKSLFIIVLVRELIFYLKVKFCDYTDHVPVPSVAQPTDTYQKKSSLLNQVESWSKSLVKTLDFLQIDSKLKHNKLRVMRFRIIGALSGIIIFLYELFELGIPWWQLLAEVIFGWITVGGLIIMTKVTRNKIVRDRILKRNLHVGPGFGAAEYRFLENIIKGKNGTPPYTEMLRRFKEKEMLPNDEVEEKVLILFPESSEEMGSIQALIDREQTKQSRRKSADEKLNSSHRVLFETIKYPYEVGCQHRTAEIHLVQVTETDETDTARASEIAKKRYFVMVENRPLKALYNMATDPVIKFTWQDFKIQLHIFMNHLRKRLDDDPNCKGMYAILHFKDKNIDIGKAILDKINYMNSGKYQKRNEACETKYCTDLSLIRELLKVEKS